MRMDWLAQKPNLRSQRKREVHAMNDVTRKFPTRSLAAAFAVCFAFAAHAVGLGSLKVQSALGQPLAAEIEVSALDAEEFTRVMARIASPEEYQAARLTYVPLLRQLRISGERRPDGRSFLNITSVSPINEPTLELLVDFNWRGGRLMQRYSVLLDPPK